MSDVFVVLKATITDFQTKLAAARAEMDATSKKGGSSFASLGGASQKALLGVAVGAAAIGAVTVKMASQFESDMELLHTNAGVAQSAIGGLEKQVLNLAGPTATAPDALADALYHLMSNGLRGAQAMDALKIAAEGAKVGHANLTDTTNALGAVIASNISGITSYTQAMGIMNATVGSGDMHMQDLADAFSTGLLASVKGFGVTIQDTGAALATFGDNNIRGAMAGTELRMAVQALAKPAAAGKAALDSIGLSQNALAKDMQTGGLKKAINDLQAHLVAAGDTGVKQGAILTEAFGKKAGVGIQVLEGQVTRFNSKFGEITKGATSFGDAWAQTQQTFSFKMQQAQASVEALGIKLGMVLIPIIERVATIMAGALQWFEKHRTAAMALAVTLGTLTIALAAVAVGLFIVENVLTLGVGAAIAGLIIGIILLVTRWNEVIKFLRSGFGTLVVLILGPVAPLALLALHWQQLWTTAKDILNTFVATARNVLNTFVNAVRTIFSTLYNNTIGLMAKLAVDAYTQAAHLVFYVLNEIGKLPGEALKLGAAMVGDLIAGISSMFGALGNIMNRLYNDTIGKVISWIKPGSPSRTFYTYGQAMMQGLANGIKAHAPAVTAALGNVQGPVQGSFTQYQRLGQQIASYVGWTGAEWNALNNLVMRESGWNPSAQNPHSSAYGIAQNINGRAGYPDPSPAGQIEWMLGYIKQRYGDPIGAWAHELSAGWYDRGGLLPPGLSLALNTTGRAEVVTPGGTGGASGGGDLVFQLGSQEFARIAGPVLRTWLLQEQRRSPLGIRAG